MGCCLSSVAVEPSASSFHGGTAPSLPHKHLKDIKDPMLTSATKVGPEGSLEAHYKLLGGTLGCGRVASVREAVDRATGVVVAVKACSKKVLNARPAYISRTIEIEALQQLWAPPVPPSPPIIRLLATHEDSRHLHIVTERAVGGDLFMSLAARSSFTEGDAIHIARQLLQAVALCHARGKPENILLSDPHTLAIKLIDFGSAALFQAADQCPPSAGEQSAPSTEEQSPTSSGEQQSLWKAACPVLRDFMGTAFYAAPEVWRHEYGPQADVWSAGAVVCVLLTGNGVVPTLPPETSPSARSFLEALLEPDPSRRPTAAGALRHPWLAASAAWAAEDGVHSAVAATAAAAATQAGAGEGVERGGERARGDKAEAEEQRRAVAVEEEGERSAREEERGVRAGEMAVRGGRHEEGSLGGDVSPSKRPVQGGVISEGAAARGLLQDGTSAEGRVRGGVQLEGSLRGFRMYAATRKLQRACVALLSLELSEPEFRQLIRHLASATSAPAMPLEPLHEAATGLEGESNEASQAERLQQNQQHWQQVQQQQQQQQPPSPMLSLPVLLASLDALGHHKVSLQLMGIHHSVMHHSTMHHGVVHGSIAQGTAKQSVHGSRARRGAQHVGATGSSAAGGKADTEERVRGGSGIAAALEEQQQQQQQQVGAAVAIPPVPLFDLLDFRALVTRHHDMHRLHHEDEEGHHSSAHAAAAGARGGRGRAAAVRGGRGKGKGKEVWAEGEGRQVEAGSSHRGSRRFFGVMRGGEGEREGESSGSVHGGTTHDGSTHGSTHGSRRFLSMMRAREGDMGNAGGEGRQQGAGGSQHGSRRFFGLMGAQEGKEKEEEGPDGTRKEGEAGGSSHGSRRFSAS
ncbi:hypothetical protein CLOM_g5324 [Closterium sp. NIES-68]|nr:hypothetical protein CLOM_g5324 [Closterium sp. NIES-68]